MDTVICTFCGHMVTTEQCYHCGRLRAEMDLRKQLQKKKQMAIVTEVLQHRDEQDAQHGGPEHDATHTLPEWKSFIQKQCDLMLWRGQEGDKDKESRQRLIKIAALALAAIESLDSKAQKESITA